jgi:hypothetical protein
MSGSSTAGCPHAKLVNNRLSPRLCEQRLVIWSQPLPFADLPLTLLTLGRRGFDTIQHIQDAHLEVV